MRGRKPHIPLSGRLSAGPSGAEGAAVGLALGEGLFVFHLDVGGAAAAVGGVVLAGRYITAHAGIGVSGLEFHGIPSFLLKIALVVCNT